MTERAPESPPPTPRTTTVAPPPDVAPQGEACLATTAQPAIQQGSSGPAVVKAQCYLNLALSGAPIPEDGDFGPVTDDSVRRFQGCAGLTVDGLVGPQTWPELVFWADAGPVC
ncbi:peptidoglycan-binding domain-containing protein [Streptomyces sp. DSM 42041]|uniref:Peptidoglycan-binding domain-containing protein n=1 Tax=Streptomyces hazeniae TaxID=3075538 RepID=A0ABU2NMG6_9ACTN|nr:peptidoglycan-binding domain-containing protein [Streptomyces sp. DSM 42041]MDT0378170.1 peptidoglycan-binding domain-containing protein [Streptomyces sp. DSM 42041]